MMFDWKIKAHGFSSCNSVFFAAHCPGASAKFRSWEFCRTVFVQKEWRRPGAASNFNRNGQNGDCASICIKAGHMHLISIFLS